MGNELVKVTSQTQPASTLPDGTPPLPGEDLYFPKDKSFVSLEGVESLALEERREMIVLATAMFLLGSALTTMLLISFLGGLKDFPVWMIKMPWWVWMLPSFISAFIWLRIKRQAAKKFKSDRDTWVKHITTQSRNEIQRTLDAIEEKKCSAWTMPAIADFANISIGRVELINFDIGLSVRMFITIYSGAPAKHGVSILGGSVRLYMRNRPNKQIIVSIERAQAEMFDGGLLPGRPPIREIWIVAPLSANFAQDISSGNFANYGDEVLARINIRVVFDADKHLQEQREIDLGEQLLSLSHIIHTKTAQ